MFFLLMHVKTFLYDDTIHVYFLYTFYHRQWDVYHHHHSSGWSGGGGGAGEGGGYIVSFNPYLESYRTPAGGAGGGGNGPEWRPFTTISNLRSGNAGATNTGGGGGAGLPPLYSAYGGTAAPQNGGSGLVKIQLVKSLTP